MLTIKKEIIEKIIKQGREEAPFEACGYLAGKDNIVLDNYPLTNLDQAEDHFTLDPKEQFSVIRDSRNKNMDILSVYHTHPVSPARPSEEDIKLAYDPNIIYTIISLIDNSINAFKIQKGEVQKLNINIT